MGAKHINNMSQTYAQSQLTQNEDEILKLKKQIPSAILVDDTFKPSNLRQERCTTSKLSSNQLNTQSQDKIEDQEKSQQIQAPYAPSNLTIYDYDRTFQLKLHKVPMCINGEEEYNPEDLDQESYQTQNNYQPKNNNIIERIKNEQQLSGNLRPELQQLVKLLIEQQKAIDESVKKKQEEMIRQEELEKRNQKQQDNQSHNQKKVSLQLSDSQYDEYLDEMNISEESPIQYIDVVKRNIRLTNKFNSQLHN